MLFSLTSDRVRFDDRTATSATLVMLDVDDHAIWFTDRPVRDSGVQPTAELAANWDPGQSFATDPPNAALVLHEPATTASGATDTLVAEIVAVDYDPAQRTFEADLRLLGDEDAESLSGNLASHGERNDATWPDEAQQASLFIDSTCTYPNVLVAGSCKAPPEGCPPGYVLYDGYCKLG